MMNTLHDIYAENDMVISRGRGLNNFSVLEAPHVSNEERQTTYSKH